MENSVLSDAAGVQKNISKMYEDYAQKIGKSTDALTQAEKAQAVYNGIMDEASMFTGSAAEMANGYQGVQSQLNASNLELSRTIGESMLPALTQYSSLQLSITKGLTEFVKNNKIASSGIITLTVGLLSTVAVFTTVKTALLAYTKATGVANTITNTFTASLMANPLFWGGLAITAGIAALNIFVSKQQESIDKMNEATEKSKTLSEALENTMNNDMNMSDSDKEIIENARDESEQIVKLYEEKKNKIEEIENEIKDIKKSNKYSFQKDGEINALNVQLNKAQKEMKSFEKEYLSGGKTIDLYRRKVEVLTKGLTQNEAKQDYLTKTNTKAHRETLINIAQTKADIDGKRQLLNILKQGKSTTDEYKDAKSQLVKIYPELAKVNENTIASTEATIDAEDRAAQAEWALAQSTIINSIAELSAMQANDEKVQQIAIATKQKVEEVRASIEEATNSLVQLSKLSIDDFKGSVTPSYTPKVSRGGGSGGGSSKSYSNKALDDYKKQIEHKKALDQISLQDEISMYQTALKRYAKTSDEKMELTEKIYSLQKELQEKSLDDYTADIEHRKALDQISLQDEINMYQYAYDNLARTTEQKMELEEKLYELRKELQEKTLDDYTSDIQHRKALDQLSLEDEIRMYNYALDNFAKTAEQKKELRETIYQLNKELAQREKDLLDQQTEDYANYMEEQKNLRGAEYNIDEQTSDYDKIIEMHRNYLNQIMKDERLSLQERKDLYREELSVIRDYEQQKRDLRISAIDDTVSHLTNAITKQLEETQEREKDLIDRNLEAIEDWKDKRIEAINEEYDVRIEAIEKELEALEKAEQQKTRDEEDAEYEKKKLRLEQLIAYEHDATTKANYQKELDKLVAEHQKTLDKRALSDKKEALKDQKELLKQQQDDEIDKIEAETERRKEQYEKQLEMLEEYYDKQIEKAEETAQQMLINAEENQNEILKLLQTYGDGYEITGQSFGEKLGQGFADKAMEKIQNAISKIQVTIDNVIESNIARLAKSTEKYTSGVAGNTIISKTVKVEQNNTITAPVDSPSIAYKKQETLNRNLANQIAGIF